MGFETSPVVEVALLVAAGRRIVSGAEKDRMAVWIRDGEAPAGELRETGFQGAPFEAVQPRVSPRKLPRFGHDAGCSPRPAQAADALPQRGVGDAEQAGDFGSAEPHIGEERDCSERRRKCFDERPWQSLLRITRRNRIHRIRRFPAAPPPLRTSDEQSTSPEYTARPGEEARVVPGALLLERREEHVLNEIVGFVQCASVP